MVEPLGVATSVGAGMEVALAAIRVDLMVWVGRMVAQTGALVVKADMVVVVRTILRRSTESQHSREHPGRTAMAIRQHQRRSKRRESHKTLDSRPGQQHSCSDTQHHNLPALKVVTPVAVAMLEEEEVERVVAQAVVARAAVAWAVV